MKKPKISFIACSGRGVFPFVVGAGFRLFKESQKDARFKPCHMAGVSGGALAVVCLTAWTCKNFTKLLEVTGKLVPSKLFKYSTKVKSKIISDLAIFGISSISIKKVIRRWLNLKHRALADILVESVMALGYTSFAATLASHFMSTPPILSSQPLGKLLAENLNFDGIFNSEIKMEIFSVDKDTGEIVMKTNYLEKDRKNLERNEDLIRHTLGSAAIPGLFEPVENRIDGAVYETAPVNRALVHGADIIILLAHEEPAAEKSDKPAFEILSDCWNMAAERATEKNIIQIEENNRNIEILENIKKKLNTIENPEIWQLIEKFKFSQKKFVKLFILQPREELPIKSLASFNKENNTESMKMGYTAMDRLIPQIREYINQNFTEKHAIGA